MKLKSFFLLDKNNRDGRACSGTSSGCFIHPRFESDDKTCNVLYDSENEMDTHWSVCYDPARTDLNVQTLKHGYIALTNTEEEYCAWGANDCPEDYGFFTVREVYGLEWLQNCMCC